MISGIASSNPIFIADLNASEQRIARDDQQISSGTSLNVASDNPEAVTPVLDDHNQIAQLTQLISNLNQQQTVAQTADGALQTASSLLNQLISLGTEGAAGTATADSNSVLAQQVEQIQQQLVGIANTSVQGQYIFGGDDPATQPYSYDWSSPEGVVSGGTPSNSIAIGGLDGSSIVPGLTAQQIFDAQAGGSPAAGNVFQAVYQLGTALASNNQSGIETALGSVQNAASYLSQSAGLYGDTENWIQQQISSATARSTNLSGAVSTLSDADVASVATDMSQAQVSLDAALSAQAGLPTKTLFSYLG